MDKKKERCVSCVTILFILFLWYISTKFGWVNTKLIPTPEKVFKAFIEVWNGYKGYTLMQHLCITFDVVLVRKEFEQEHPEYVTAYIKAVDKAVKLYQDDAEKAAEQIADALQLSA